MNNILFEQNAKSDLEARLVKYAVLIIEISEDLPKTPAGNHLTGQLVRSGTSPALNYGEASSAESRKDFIHKIKIVLKELKETRIALKIIQMANMFPDNNKVESAIKETGELVAIFITSVNTALRNMKSQNGKQ
ncbi:MAG: four helix bundle protein [Bacteroidales bacterium]|nr:four helix bundle protein [Bacteroidales bacterium]